MIQVGDLKPGTTFGYEKEIYTVLDIEHNKTAMRGMIIKCKIKNLRNGVIKEVTFGGSDKVDDARLDKRPYQYLYADGEMLVFMDSETFEQINIPKDRLTWELNFLVENQSVEITSYEGEILGINLPVKVALKVIKTEPGVRGDTATKAMKDAKMETGYMVKVPLFINEGETLIIRTDNGLYDSRA